MMASYKMLLTVLMIVVVATTSIEAGRRDGRGRQRGRGRGPAPPPPQRAPAPAPAPAPVSPQQDCENCFSWIRDIGGDNNAEESARFDPERLLVQVKSVDDSLTANGLTKSKSLYTFDDEGSNGVLVVRLIGVGRSPCFLIVLQDSTFNDTVALLDTRNDSTVVFDSPLKFDGVNVRLGPGVGSAIFRVSPVVGRVCKNRPLIFASQLSAGDNAPAYSVPFTFLSLENRITIYARLARPRDRRGRNNSEEDD